MWWSPRNKKSFYIKYLIIIDIKNAFPFFPTIFSFLLFSKSLLENTWIKHYLSSSFFLQLDILIPKEQNCDADFSKSFFYRLTSYLKERWSPPRTSTRCSFLEHMRRELCVFVFFIPLRLKYTFPYQKHNSITHIWRRSLFCFVFSVIVVCCLCNIHKYNKCTKLYPLWLKFNIVSLSEITLIYLLSPQGIPGCQRFVTLWWK